MAQEDPGTTRWSWSADIPVRRFLRTESGSASILLAATIAALLWANVATESYDAFWHTEAGVTVGHAGIELTLVEWINSGLMTFYFFVVGLETRREFDIGELRERRRVILPAMAGAAGMLATALIFVVINRDSGAAHGWGVALSTDTAFALGVLALVGPRFSERLRAFLLTVVITDDVIALVAIATVYTEQVVVLPLMLAVAALLVVVALKRVGVHSGVPYFLVGLAGWAALQGSGVDPVVIGLVLGLLTFARPVDRENLERATDTFRDFREQPTSELARSARASVQRAVPPNERLQALWHPWTSYVIVPLFALANAGIVVKGDFLATAFRSPITWGVIAAYVIGKPLGIVGGSWLVTRMSRGRLRPSVGWAAVAGAGTVSGIGFTLSLLIATIAFEGRDLDEAKLGILTAAVVSSVITWLVFRAVALLPAQRRARALLGVADTVTDLADPVDPERDHVRGPDDSPVTLVEYGDFQCPYCGLAEPVVRQVLADVGDVRYVWRHLPLRDVHPQAQLAAEAAEAAGEQGAFWEMHALLLGRQDALEPADLVRYAEELGLDTRRFVADLKRHEHEARVADDVESAEMSGVRGTPTFFVNGLRYHGAYDVEGLEEAVRLARAKALALD
ncbi:MAG: Na+/H+ antiporter NhaA [Candidatus Nanopelagicales bacterium]